jgi:L-2,4-diaminobutyrate decarboxylase
MMPHSAASLAWEPPVAESTLPAIAFDAVFTPNHFHEAADLIVGELDAYLADPSIRGLSLRHPIELLQQARELMSTDNRTSSKNTLDLTRLRKIIRLYIETGIQVHSPGVMGRQFSGIIPLAGLVDMVGTIVNQPSSFYEAGQLPNVAEHLLGLEFAKLLGWDEDRFDMVSTSGGSLANLTAILCARNKYLPQVWNQGLARGTKQGIPAIALGANAHYSISRAAGIMGIGEEQIIRIPLNADYKIDPVQAAVHLDAAKENGLNVFCLVAAAGSTNTGGFDDFEALAGIAQKHDCWLHVDAAHGGSLLLSDSLRSQYLKGLEKADSFIIDAHKMLFVPSLCTLLFYKNKAYSKQAFRQKASYVFEDEPDVFTLFEGAGKNFECTKRPAIMNLWVSWAMYGRRLFADKIEYLCALTAAFHQMLGQQPDFTTLHAPESNILCFRYTPHPMSDRDSDRLQILIRDRIKADGVFFISKTDIDEVSVLRVVFMNHKITLAHCGMLLSKIRELTADIAP